MLTPPSIVVKILRVKRNLLQIVRSDASGRPEAKVAQAIIVTDLIGPFH